MKAIEFDVPIGKENDEGLLSKGVYHLEGAQYSVENTLCGFLLINLEEAGRPDFIRNDFKMVDIELINCPLCTQIINHCRQDGIKTI